MDALPNEKMLYYSIGFVNDPKLFDEYENYKPNLEPLIGTPGIILRLGMMPIGQEHVANALEFIQMPLKEQRALVATKDADKKKQLEAHIRSIFVIIGNVYSDLKLVKYFILLIDGILEGFNLIHHSRR